MFIFDVLCLYVVLICERKWVRESINVLYFVKSEFILWLSRDVMCYKFIDFDC